MAALQITRRRKAQDYVIGVKGKPFAFPDGKVPVWAWRPDAMRAAARCTAEGKGEHVVMTVTARMRDLWRAHRTVLMLDRRC